MPALSSERKRFLEAATLRYAKHLGEHLPSLVARGLDAELLQAEGFGVVRDPMPGHEKYEGMVCIPYLTDAGPVGLRFRCMQDHEHGYHGKYNTPKGQSGMLYGVQQVSQRKVDDWICVTEGELDSLILRQVGFPALAAPGAKVWKEHWPNIFEDFSRVYVFTDGDKAGTEMWEKWSNSIETATIRVEMPAGEDVNSFYQRYGAEALKAKVKLG